MNYLNFNKSFLQFSILLYFYKYTLDHLEYDTASIS